MKKIALFLLFSCSSFQLFSAGQVKFALSTGWRLTKISSIFAAGYYVKSQDTENVLGSNAIKIAHPLIERLKAFNRVFKNNFEKKLHDNELRNRFGLPLITESTDIENPTSALHIPTAHLASSWENIKTRKTEQENNSIITTITKENDLTLSNSKEDMQNNSNN